MIAILAVGAIVTGGLYDTENRGIYLDAGHNRLATANEFSLATDAKTDSAAKASLNLRPQRGG